ncbi:MAG: hypothetical protein QM737_16455 [Ferruginibacter sp.]
MKKIILFAIVVSTMVSCKKESGPSCEKTVAKIAANYKLTKVETVSTTGTSDATDTYLDACKKNSFYSLKTDNTYTYTEINSTCTGSSTGTWSIGSNNTIKITRTTGTGGFEFIDAPIESWDCSTLKITQSLTSGGGVNVNLRFTFVKQ